MGRGNCQRVLGLLLLACLAWTSAPRQEADRPPKAKTGSVIDFVVLEINDAQRYHGWKIEDDRWPWLKIKDEASGHVWINMDDVVLCRSSSFSGWNR